MEKTVGGGGGGWREEGITGLGFLRWGLMISRVRFRIRLDFRLFPLYSKAEAEGLPIRGVFIVPDKPLFQCYGAVRGKRPSRLVYHVAGSG